MILPIELLELILLFLLLWQPVEKQVDDQDYINDTDNNIYN
jgi:hypothetical protein